MDHRLSLSQSVRNEPQTSVRATSLAITCLSQPPNRRTVGVAARLCLVATLVAATTAVAPGCAAPSLLITPVTSRRTLDETQLSRDSFWATGKIALIDVSGIISNTASSSLLGGEGEHPVSLFLEQLDKARRDPAVKAVVLRINSPGGTVVASELMHDEIMHFKRSGKPIVAIMMDVAASGGYYIACACDEIIAHASTVTGSIGVVMQLFEVSGTMRMIGMTGDAITSGTFKDTGSPFRTMRPEEREIFQEIVNEMYGRFVGVVAAGRSQLDEDEVRRLADGRVYTAKQAMDAGLIDTISNLRGAISSAKHRAGIDDARVVTYHRPHEYRPNYYAVAPRGAANSLSITMPAISTGLPPRFMYVWKPGL